jgi:hypothetical protein
VSATLTICTPTIGRDTLHALIRSAEGTIWQPQDQWIIVGDNIRTLPEWLEGFVTSLGHPFLWATHQDPLSCAGNSQRNHGISLAHPGNYLVWMDDNDTLTEGALNVIRESIPAEPAPLQFDVTWMGSNRGLSDIETFPMTFPNEHGSSMESAGGGQQFVTPNLPDKLARWQPPLGSSDYYFVRDNLLLWGGPGALKQVDYLIAHTT